MRTQLEPPYMPAFAGSCFQMNTLPSYEALARMVPNDGCAQATCQTGPVCPASVSPAPVATPFCTSNTLTVASEEQVASFFP